MLIGSNALLFVWSACFTCESPAQSRDQPLTRSDLKYKYWYVYIPDVGYMSVPIMLYTPSDLKFAQSLNVLVTGMLRVEHYAGKY